MKQLLIGKSMETSLYYSGLAIFISFFIFSIMYIGFFLINTRFLLTGLAALIGLVILTAVPATIHSYKNKGMLISIFLAVTPILAEQEFTLIFRIGEPYPDEGLLYGVGLALLFGVPIGIISFIVGQLFRRFVPKPPNSTQPENETEIG